MTGFASLRSAVGTPPRHAFIEFAMMDIGMAGGACPILEMERQDLVLSAAVPCSDCHKVGAGENPERYDNPRICLNTGRLQIVCHGHPCGSRCRLQISPYRLCPCPRVDGTCRIQR